MASSAQNRLGRAGRGPDAAARDRVFALLSHEIRTPLNGVMGMAGLLAATPLDATQTAYLDSLRDCADHLLGLVNNMLDLAKLEAGKVELEPAPTDVERLLQGVCELLSPKAHAAGLEIGWAVDADVPILLADDGRLRQILFNLAGNAVKLTASGGVLVTAERAGPAPAGSARIRFTVHDTGPGLAPTDARRIFQDFVQTEVGERAGGAGLGLAIVTRLVEALDGEVGVDSAPGEGASFWFEAAFQIADEPSAARPLTGVRVRVETASAILRQAAGRQLAACGAVLKEGGRCDVRLIDAVTPPRTLGKHSAPALVLVAPEQRAAIESFRARGYAGYLIKPLRRASLAERILAVAGASAAPAQPVQDERAEQGASAAGLRVLLAEDNPINALLARALLSRAGCTVDTASGGEEAVSAALAHPYDLVLMDMRMPGMSGLEAARAIRGAGRSVPIVALTANAFEDDRRACREAGMDGFLTKPLDPSALQGVLTRLRAEVA